MALEGITLAIICLVCPTCKLTSHSEQLMPVTGMLELPELFFNASISVFTFASSEESVSIVLFNDFT